MRFVETYRHDAEPRSNNEADQGACAANAPGDATGIRAGDAASKIAPARNSSSHNAPNAQPPQRSDGFPTTPVAPMNEYVDAIDPDLDRVAVFCALIRLTRAFSASSNLIQNQAGRCNARRKPKQHFIGF